MVAAESLGVGPVEDRKAHGLIEPPTGVEGVLGVEGESGSEGVAGCLGRPPKDGERRP